jgi:hypothetical protein
MSPLALALRQAWMVSAKRRLSGWMLCGATQCSVCAITTGVVRISTVLMMRCRSGLASTTQPSVAFGARANCAGGVPCSQMPLPVLPRRWSYGLG